MGPLSETIARAASRLLFLYFRFVGRSLRVTVRLPDGSCADTDLSRVLNFFEAQRDVGPSLYILWTSDHLNLLSLGFASDQLLDFAKRFRFFADDSLGGTVMRSAMESLGVLGLLISQTDPVSRLTLLRSVIETRTSAFLVVDGRGPYFEIATGVVNLAKAMGAAIVPCSVTSTPRLIFPHPRVRVELPVPGSHVTLNIGTPRLMHDTHIDARIVADQLKVALMRLREEALSTVTTPPSP